MLVIATGGLGAEQLPERPNVLLLLSDDQRPDTIDALGNSVIRTANLDRLIREGTTFLRAAASYPLCVPSRAEILTGATGFRNGVLPAHSNRLDPSLETWAEVMRDAGYHTWYVGKWHTSGRPSDHGYEKTLGLFASGGGEPTFPRDVHGRKVTGYRGWVFQTDAKETFPDQGVGVTPDISERIAAAAIDVIARKPERPFFLHVNFTAPHDPLLLPPGYEELYRPESMPLPANFQPLHPFDHGNFWGRDEQLLPWPRTPADVRADLAAYYAVISHMDASIGRILKALEETEQLEKTLIIFASDHGLAMGSHGLRGKQNMYEHTIGVPLIVRGPNIPRGKRTKAQVYLRDLFPTTCELTGIPIPDSVQGRSFAPILSGTKEAIYRHIFGLFGDSQRMVRGERYKLIEYPQIEQTQFFDLERDPWELNNLADDPAHAAVVRELRDVLRRWQQEMNDPLVSRRSGERALPKDHRPGIEGSLNLVCLSTIQLSSKNSNGGNGSPCLCLQQ
ncbi:MAG: sulfatase-like hydrolase/transferase [Luteitalea sp.]|nr:sulfatase-like hydrolase/transferase [Luteitalea sp.]